jgi:hypothetical protein
MGGGWRGPGAAARAFRGLPAVEVITMRPACRSVRPGQWHTVRGPVTTRPRPKGAWPGLPGAPPETRPAVRSDRLERWAGLGVRLVGVGLCIVTDHRLVGAESGVVAANRPAVLGEGRLRNRRRDSPADQRHGHEDREPAWMPGSGARRHEWVPRRRSEVPSACRSSRRFAGHAPYRGNHTSRLPSCSERPAPRGGGGRSPT